MSSSPDPTVQLFLLALVAVVEELRGILGSVKEPGEPGF
jgi:hypothetical protein